MVEGFEDYSDRRLASEAPTRQIVAIYQYNIEKVGTWDTVSDSDYYTGTRIVSNVTANEVRFRFWGSFIGLLYFRHTYCGIAEITIDGTPYDDLDTYYTTIIADQVYMVSETLADTNHEIRIKVSGRKNAASTGYYISLHGFIVDAAKNPTLFSRTWAMYCNLLSPIKSTIELIKAKTDNLNVQLSTRLATADLSIDADKHLQVDIVDPSGLNDKDYGARTFLIKDIDPTPVGDVLLKCLDQVLKLRDSGDTAYTAADLLSLLIGGTTVITSARVLQNIVMDAALVTSGRFPLARMPANTLNYVLRAQGAGVSPIYEDILSTANPQDVALTTGFKTPGTGVYGSRYDHVHELAAGRFGMARMPDGTSSYVLTAKGAGVDPAYEALTVPSGARVRAYQSTSQTIGTAAWTKVNLQTENWDILGEFDNTTNYRYTATVAGYYQVIGAVRFQASNVDKNFGVGIYKNEGAASLVIVNAGGSTVGISLRVSDDIYLAVGSYIELYCRNYDSANRNLENSTTETFLAIHLI